MPDETKATDSNGGLIARLGAKLRAARDQVKNLTTENATLKTQVTTLTTENTDLKTKADSDTNRKRVAELEGEIRTGKHRAKFDQLVKDAGGNPEAADDIYAWSGYKADSDTIDEAAMKTAIDGVKAKKPFAFGAAAAAQNNGNGAPAADPPKPGPAGGRGGNQPAHVPPAIDEYRALNDPAYAMANYDRIVEHNKAKVALGAGAR
jgi:hypothetical protein